MSDFPLVRMLVILLSVFVGVALIASGLTAEEDDRALVVGLGDSYSSGLGVPPYEPGTQENQCFRSDRAYVHLVADELDYEVRNVACSGATTDAFTNTYRGEAAQVSQLMDADVIVFSIGGNDVRALQTLASEPAAVLTDQFLVDFRDVQMPELRRKLDATYAAVEAAAPDAYVTVVGYPNVFPPQSSDFANCPGIDPFLGQIASGLPTSNLIQAGSLLNETIRAAAVEAGFGFIDPTESFVGHGICSQDRFVWGTVDAPSPNETLHPNEAGHRAIAEDLTRAISGVRDRT